MADSPNTPKPNADPVRASVPRRRFGRHDEQVSAIGLGGFHIGTIAQDEEAVAFIRAAIDAGITFLDNCWDYHDGLSELRMGRALADGYRDRVFLMTKVDGRTKKAAARQIDDSLLRLRTDRIDLMQFHEVIRLEDPDRIFAPGGAMEAFAEAQRAGKIRYVGFTGHKDPLVHLRMLDVAAEHGVRFDAVQMPLNVLDAHFRSFAQQVLPRLVADGIAVLGMKPLAAGAVMKANTGLSAIDCLRYALSLPTTVVITGMESRERLDQALEAARGFVPMTEAERAALLAKTEKAARGGVHEPFKTGTEHDGTAQNVDWLG